MRAPDYIELLLDERGKRLAIKACDQEINIPFCVNKSNAINARINNKEFSRRLFNLLG